MLPTSLYTAQQSRALDKQLCQELGISSYELMCRAGKAVFDYITEQYPAARRWVLVCGTGNNGGDGFVVAAWAHRAGLDLVVLLVGDAAHIKGDALLALHDMGAAGVVYREFSASYLTHAEVVVDALFGIGLERDLVGAHAHAIKAINQSAAQIVSVDLPSGLHADDGNIRGVAVRAQATVTLVALKPGLFTGDGPDMCGQLQYADLGAARVLAWMPSHAQRLAWPPLAALAPRKRNSHKGEFGHVVVLGGDVGMAGAPVLAASAALAVGAGRCTLASHKDHVHYASMSHPELMTVALDQSQRLQNILAQASVLALGPGLGTGDWAQEAWQRVSTFSGKMVVDADGLNLLAQSPRQNHNWILTPHPGEAARLLGVSTHEVQQQRIAAAKKIQQRYGGVCVLKGCGTIICDAQQVWICDAGNPAQASAGMGDVLTGVIAGLLAQGLSLQLAATQGVLLHAHAADQLLVAGQARMLASDLFPLLKRYVAYV